MSKTDGGPAFPDVSLENPGMSLRDYFAAQALTIVSDAIVLEAMKTEAKNQGIPVEDGIAQSVYGIADAMVKERAK